MRLSVNIETQTILLEVAEDLEMENFKALVEMEVRKTNPFGNYLSKVYIITSLL
ncbi:hypothetical protein E2C01_078337 [Portunus trituberculatus]|uniref:Uncharacterized protein n=1 Tax=Portunus trituberculatus TaxID=210409 RepID=A0A5B7IMC9_PORTR|nr:hypothetical protein [Portunus trituberculatus]